MKIREDDCESAICADISGTFHLGLDRLGLEFPEYRPTLRFDGAFVDAAHQAIAELPIEGGLIRGSVQGFLRRADALTLYELAYGTRGNVLELGSAWGLSTSILCRAVMNSRREAKVVSLEIDPAFQRATSNTIEQLGCQSVYEGIAGDADVTIQRLISHGRRFELCFVDHDHSYGATTRICRHLPNLMEAGGFVVFHDFNDERNRTEPESYGVYQAVCELLQTSAFSLAGIIGCCALLKRSDKHG